MIEVAGETKSAQTNAAAVDVAAETKLTANAVIAAPAIGNSVDCEGNDTCAGDS